MDKVYFGGGSSRVMTLWMPLVDVSLEHGALAWVPGSHAGAFQESVVAPYVAATSLGQDGTRTGWLQEGHDGFDWVSTKDTNE